MLREMVKGRELKDWAQERMMGMEDWAWMGRRWRVSIICVCGRGDC